MRSTSANGHATGKRQAFASGLLAALSCVACATVDEGRGVRSDAAGLATTTTTVAASSSPVPDVDTPRRYTDAELVLERGFTALERGDDAVGLGYLRAVLRSDFLTPRGRAQVYWSAAGAARRIGDRDGERSHLEGFLLVRETLPDDDHARDADLAIQASIARGVLLAHQVEERGLGRAPSSALVVEDEGDTRATIAALSCGEDGRDALAFVDEALVERGENILLRRGVVCTSGGDRFHLWFDVSSALSAARERQPTARNSPLPLRNTDRKGTIP